MEGARDFITAFHAKKFMPEDTFKENTKKSIDKYFPLFERVSVQLSLLHYKVFCADSQQGIVRWASCRRLTHSG